MKKIVFGMSLWFFVVVEEKVGSELILRERAPQNRSQTWAIQERGPGVTLSEILLEFQGGLPHNTVGPNPPLCFPMVAN